MANQFINPSVVAREALMLLRSNMVAANLVYRDHEAEFNDGKAKGDVITIRKPATFTASEFTGSISAQGINEKSIALKLDKHFDVSAEVTAKELTLDIDQFSQRVIAPMALALAEKIDSYVLSLGKQIPNFVGTAGTAPGSIADLAAIDKRLTDQKCAGPRSGLLGSKAKAGMIVIPSVLEANKRGDGGEALRRAEIGEVMNVNYYGGLQNIYSHTAGSASTSGTWTVNGAHAADATTLALTGGAGTETFLEGDVIEIAGLPVGQNHFAIAADATASAGSVTVTLTRGLPQALSGSEGVTVKASHEVNIAGNLKGIALAVVPLEMPMQQGMGEVINYDGLSIRAVYDYDSTAKKNILSLDVLCGGVVAEDKFLTRILS